MFPSKGYKVFKQHWKDQVIFMDKQLWDKDKILKLTISTDFNDNLKNFNFQIIRLKKGIANLH